MNMRIPLKFVWHMFAYICFVAILCEYLIYYFVIFQCSWPVLDPLKEDSSVHIKTNSNEPVKAMFLADTHLLGSRNGHWFDKLRREWQMYRAFKTAVSLHKPEVVFFLGDVFDEGLWCGKDEFEYYVAHFNNLFKVPDGTKVYVVVGNHDIGFHYSISPYLHERFMNAFNAPPIKMVSIRGNHFVLLNSMAMEGDGCFLCRQAEIKLMGIADKLRCIQGVGKSCDSSLLRKQFSRPIILQHFPMFRDSDRNCDEPDEAPEDLKKMKFRERWECLSQEATDMLFYQLNPRAVFTGHTHHGCHTTHKVPAEIHEYTLPSFSWRNKNNPSFMLAMISPNNYAVSKCYMPQESTVIFLYSISLSFFVFWVARSVYLFSSKRHNSIRLFKSC
ncbi:Metallophosphoesterase 1 [Frankliniella fusca]|uniref:Metallophosphoesterase 1 homolog n=1 Tax=Frankliniella fusca TaxID=407009 RepID=A0AAE1LD04_9NEOP|nr:Metallophosphoesterase 1 [Frankliniella fusca]